MLGIVLGGIVGKIGKSKFVKTMKMHDCSLSGSLTRPVSLVLPLLTALTLVFSTCAPISGRQGPVYKLIVKTQFGGLHDHP